MSRTPADPDTIDTPLPDEPLRVLVIDDERAHAETICEALDSVGYHCTVAHSGQAGAALIDKGDFDLVLTDLKMGEVDGLQIVRKVRQELPEAEVVVISGFADVKTAVTAITEGAANFLLKPVDLGELRAIVNKVGEKVRLARANRDLRRQLDERFGFEGLIGHSPRIREVLSRLQAIAPTSARVLIVGETGTGKELIAKAIHNNSPRKNKPFVAMNCTALNENLLDDELFGHEAGAFTGADKLRKGRFEHANGGTLFLDEVGDMPLTLQAKLLRVLENDEVFRIGSNEAIKVNVRLLSATHRDLEAAVKAGTFRQDLFHRLKVVTVSLPPLRERRDDIPVLTAHFLKEFSQRHGKKVGTVSDQVWRAFAAHDWPGNIRELRNTVESMVVLDHDGVLGLDDLQEGDALKAIAVPAAMDSSTIGPDHLIGRPLTDVERYYIEKALERTDGNREEASRMLGIGERTLYRVIQDWKLQDKIRAAFVEANNNLERAAGILNLKPAALERKVRKWGWRVGDQ